MPEPLSIFNSGSASTALRHGGECPVCFRHTVRGVRSWDTPDEIWCSHCHCQFYDESMHWGLSDDGIREARCYYWIVRPLLYPYRLLRAKLNKRRNEHVNDWVDLL